MRKLFIIAFSLVVFNITGCLKDTPGTDLSHEGTIIELMYPAGAGDAGVGTGLEFFSGDAITFPSSDLSDTVTFYVNIAGTNTLSQSLGVTVTVDNSALEDNIANDGITYVAMPDSYYSIVKTSGSIAAGQRIDTFQIVIYPSKIDPTQNFGLPITVSTNPGETISGNFGIMYLHTIGNPLAGVYNDSLATRYNYVGSTPAYTYPGPEPAPASTLDLTPYFPKTAGPNSPTEIEIPYANDLGNYIIDFDASYNLTVTTDVTGITNFTVIYANYNPTTKTIHLVTSYVNGAGNGRIVDETMVHQ
jgi:hypothetical protein